MNDTVQRAMLLIGNLPGSPVYWAEPGLFDKPGIYVWNGERNVHMGMVPEGPDNFSTRLIAERDALDTRYDKLAHFINGDPAFVVLPTEQRRLLVAQHRLMGDYLEILNQRIQLLGLDAPPKPVPHDAGDREEILESRVTGGGSSETPIPFNGDTGNQGR